MCKIITWIQKGGYVTSDTVGPLHRFLLGAPPQFDVDHVNGRPLDNQKANLRIATRSQNMHNARRRKDNTSGEKGVSFDRHYQMWEAYYKLNGRQKKVGRFHTKEEATAAVRRAREAAHGDFACHGVRELP